MNIFKNTTDDIRESTAFKKCSGKPREISKLRRDLKSIRDEYMDKIESRDHTQIDLERAYAEDDYSKVKDLKAKLSGLEADVNELQDEITDVNDDLVEAEDAFAEGKAKLRKKLIPMVDEATKELSDSLEKVNAANDRLHELRGLARFGSIGNQANALPSVPFIFNKEKSNYGHKLNATETFKKRAEKWTASTK